MSRLHGIRHRLADDRGSVLVFVAIGLPALLAVFAIAADVGNWFVHHRSLQNQVDAAALAGANLFNDCFNGTGSGPMISEAATYAGTYNPQYGGPHGGTESFAYNSNTYPSGATTGDTVQSDPCTAPYELDVKGSESNLPLMLGGLLPGSLPLAHVDAHARVQLRQATTFSGSLPLGVPDPSPTYVFATFVDESTGAPIAGCASGCTVQLEQAGTSGGMQLWSSVSAPLSVPIVRDTGVRVRLVGGTDPSAACGQALVSCYDAGSANGLVHIRGWSSAAAPSVQNAWLLPGGCKPDAYFATAACSAGLQAEIDLGASHPLTGTLGQVATVTASAAGTNVTATQATPSGGCTPSGATCNVWTFTGLPLPASGPTPVSVVSWTWTQTSGTWQGNACTTKGNNPCTDSGNFGGSNAGIVVQRGFVGDPTRSGPVQELEVGDASVPSVYGANSFQAGTTRSLTVTLGTLGSLAVQSAASDPTIELRIAGSGSQTQSVDCDPTLSTLRDEIHYGCSPRYTFNTGTPCADYNTLWSTPQPWNCVKAQTGGATGQVAQGLQDRILLGSSTCNAPINWPNWSEGDRRIVSLFLVPFNALNGNGNTTVPVIGVATFYVTGWQGDPCPGATPVASQGDIAGHFIKYAAPDPGSAGTTACSATALAPCVPVMTR